MCFDYFFDYFFDLFLVIPKVIKSGLKAEREVSNSMLFFVDGTNMWQFLVCSYEANWPNNFLSKPGWARWPASMA